MGTRANPTIANLPTRTRDTAPLISLWRAASLVLLCFCLAVACSHPTSSEDTGLAPIDATPREDGEAELIAVCLSGELVAPQDLYHEVRSNLVAIRAAFGDTLVAVHISFVPPWVVGELLVGLDDTTAQKVRDGRYTAWDELNRTYRVTHIDTPRAGTCCPCAVLHFDGRLHPGRLGELYEVLPGVRYADPDALGGDWPNLYARQTLQGITYLFRDAWGDCLAGCIYNEYWYFTFDRAQPVYVGHWLPHEQPEAPQWWEEARKNREQYRGF